MNFIIENLWTLANIVGFIGMTSLLVCYYLTQEWKIKVWELPYLHLNFVGGTLLLLSLLVHTNIASLTLEVIYISIWIRGYFKYFKNKTNLEKNESNADA